jgi:hypothetical protein
MSVNPEKVMKMILFIGAVLISGCTSPKEKVQEKPLARVLDHYLYRNDLAGVIPHNLSAEDCTKIVKDFVEKWVRNQLILSKAELNLTEEEKNVELQIENYRSSLLIYAYEQSYLRQNLDTLVTQAEVESYYKENQSNFILNESLMKGVFIKVPVKAPEIYKVRQWVRSENPENIKNLEGYCFKYASVFDHFNDGWIKMNEILPMIPAVWGNSESAILSRRYIETHDSSFYYFLSAKEIVPAGNVSPLETVKNDIQSIILNKRKIKLINELESNIFSDAQNREHFTIYQ